MKRLALSSAAAGAALLAVTLAGCGSVPAKGAAGDGSHRATTRAGRAAGSSSPSSSSGSSNDSTPTTPAPVSLKANVENKATGVTVDTIVSVAATDGTVSKVKLWTRTKAKNGSTQAVKVAGTLSADHLTWTARSALDPGSKYRLQMWGRNASGQPTVKAATSFKTERLGLHQQTFATIQPALGTKVGVGMPVILNFDLPVKDRKGFQRHLEVTSTGHQKGTWSWYGNKSVHFRPEHFWKPGTTVTVKADLNGVKAGHGRYGQNSTSTSFTVGPALITRVDLSKDVAKVYENRKLVRTIKVTGGKTGWRTRSGTKLVMAKEYNKVMTNEAIGAKEKYRLVAKYAMRVTNSGEFLHSAPWSMRNLGVRNASHGCTGMSISDSSWLYHRVLPGDPVITTGTHRKIEQGNGWTDWDISYAQYQKNSAI